MGHVVYIGYVGHIVRINIYGLWLCGVYVKWDTWCIRVICMYAWVVWCVLVYGSYGVHELSGTYRVYGS